MIDSTKTRHSLSPTRRPHFPTGSHNAELQSNAEIEEHLRNLLQVHGHGRLGEIEVDVENDSITISGVVATYYQLQLAQTIVMKHAEGRTLENSILVD